MQQWLPGHKLKNRPYQIEQELGQGGFGITYKALDLTLDIPVVIKTPNSKLQRDGNYQKYVANFTREAKQLAKLGLNPHPHIVRVSSLFQEDDLPCIVMDFIPGQSLYDLVYTQGKLSETKAVEYIKQIGSALSVCHSAGIVHRDVHPNNILIHRDNGKAVLIDFGISGSTQTSRNTHSGNRAFAPWEQIAYWEAQDSKTPQVDIYTLAASLYFLVTGQEPTECLARKYNNSELIEPKQLNPELSDRLNQAIIKGVEVFPGDRPNSMQEWLGLLSESNIFLENSSNLQPSIYKHNIGEQEQIEETLPEIEIAQEEFKADLRSSIKQRQDGIKENHSKRALIETRKINYSKEEEYIESKSNKTTKEIDVNSNHDYDYKSKPTDNKKDRSNKKIIKEEIFRSLLTVFITFFLYQHAYQFLRQISATSSEFSHLSDIAYYQNWDSMFSWIVWIVIPILLNRRRFYENASQSRLKQKFILKINVYKLQFVACTMLGIAYLIDIFKVDILLYRNVYFLYVTLYGFLFLAFCYLLICLPTNLVVIFERLNKCGNNTSFFFWLYISLIFTSFVSRTIAFDTTLPITFVETIFLIPKLLGLPS